MKKCKSGMIMLLAVLLLTVIAPAKAQAAEPASGCLLLGLEGTYYGDAQTALDRINEIRYEACTDGNVPDPRNSGRMLTAADYVPIRWSADLERVARIRAAEAALTVAHDRMNGTDIWSVSSNGVSSYAEDLAWNWSRTMVSGIEQWYEEKSDWVNQNAGKVTGHYTSIINPSYTYIGLGDFNCSKAAYRNTVAGELGYGSNRDETMLAIPGTVVQDIEVLISSCSNYQLTAEKITLVTGETENVAFTVDCTISTGLAGTRTYTGLPVTGGAVLVSSDPSVVSLGSAGQISALKEGTATISATVNGSVVSTLTITVDHTIVTDAGVAATCTEAGKTEGSHCQVCGAVIQAQTVIPATGHTAVSDPAIAASCTASGKTEGSHCQTCGTVIQAQTVIPATGHTAVSDPAIAASCTASGKTQGSHCQVCGAVIQAQTVIPATGHTVAIRNQKEATSLEAGYTGDEYCTVCQTVISTGTVIPKLMNPGWNQIDGKWYYVDEKGEAVSGWAKVNGKWYYMNQNYVMETGWQQLSGKWYYLGTGGAMATGWQKINNIWYYLGTDGAMATEWKQIGGSWYYFGSNGNMRTGWQQVGGKWYYLGTNGAMTTGWQKVGGTWYYLGTSGAMATGWQKVGSSWYYLGTNGAMRTGWQQIDSKWYYLGTGGAMETGWKQISGTWYYFYDSGVMAADTMIGSSYVNSNGAYVPGVTLADGMYVGYLLPESIESLSISGNTLLLTGTLFDGTQGEWMDAKTYVLPMSDDITCLLYYGEYDGEDLFEAIAKEDFLSLYDYWYPDELFLEMNVENGEVNVLLFTWEL